MTFLVSVQATCGAAVEASVSAVRGNTSQGDSTNRERCIADTDPISETKGHPATKNLI